MKKNTIQDYLSLIEKPSRYLGSEINAIKKDPKTVKLHMALAFPDLYEIGTSHFGIQILYHILNQNEDVFAERFFCPDVDLEKHYREQKLSVVSQETKTPLNHFDLIGFSLLYELNYTNILTLLDLANIPFYSSKRDHSHPIIIAGGPCTFNPEPIADFFDAIVIGDGEDVITEMVKTWLNWKASPEKDKINLLKDWSNIDGVYVPAFFKSEYDDFGLQTLIPQYSNYKGIHRAILDDLDRAPFPEKPIIPFGKPIHDRLRLEISRGCTRGCRFCQAGMIYRPVRERSIQEIDQLARASLKNTGYEDLSLLSLSTGDYSCIQALMERLMANGEQEHTAISLPSIRAGTLTPRLMELIKKVRKTGFTIAPEAGSQRLRNVINKNISDQEIIDTVKNAFQMGWKVIKLYFMIGLPTETKADIQDIIKLVKKIREIKNAKGRMQKINVSITTFVPKAHTPFEREKQISLVQAKEKIDYLKNELKLNGVKVKWQNPEVSQIEGLWARGDRRLSRLLVNAYEKGCKFDGWSEHFNYSYWTEACEETGVDINFYNYRERSVTENQPWDHINAKIRKKFLNDEYQKSRNSTLTEDCRNAECNQCGVCDFDKIKPMIKNDCKINSGDQTLVKQQQIDYKNITMTYSKTGTARFFGHLELVNIMNRAIRRAGIPIKYTEGFHPKPKISFLDPLPIGMESQKEYMFIFVQNEMKVDNLKDRINEHLPEGLKIHQCRLTMKTDKKEKYLKQKYNIYSEKELFDQEQIRLFKQKHKMIIKKKNKKGKEKELDLKLLVEKIEWIDKNSLTMIIKPTSEKNMRPIEVIKQVFKFDAGDLRKLRVIKIDKETKLKNV